MPFFWHFIIFNRNCLIEHPYFKLLSRISVLFSAAVVLKSFKESYSLYVCIHYIPAVTLWLLYNLFFSAAVLFWPFWSTSNRFPTKPRMQPAESLNLMDLTCGQTITFQQEMKTKWSQKAESFHCLKWQHVFQLLLKNVLSGFHRTVYDGKILTMELLGMDLSWIPRT